MKWRIWEQKLLLVKAIRQLEDNVLAKEVFDQQLEMGWPGLNKEATEICESIGLPDVCRKDVSKQAIQEAVFYDHYKELKQEVASFKNDDFRTAQPYMKQNCLEFCRMAFRLRTRQFICRTNMPRMYGGVLWCHNCSTA